MTDAEIVQHLAEKVMVWQRVEFDVPGGDPLWGWKPSDGGEFRGGGWNPLESRDDCAAVESALPEEKRMDYIGYLECFCVPRAFDYDLPDHQFAIATATPRQRCLAMVEATR